MRVLLVHNRYRTSAPSGEDAAVVNEQRMLEKRGVEVRAFNRCNDDIDDSSLLSKTALAANTIWSRRSRRELRETLRRFRPDVTHVHNTFSVLSPSVYGVCQSEGSAVVQTLHNFRFFCPGALFLRDGKPCEECVDKGLLQSVRHRCYRGSLAATATLASMLALHRALGTYAHHIDRYIALTQFAKSKMIRGGIDASKLAVKPNFVPDPPPAGAGAGGYVAYVGRLLHGKGTETLLAAWRQLPDVKLKIVGDGALRGTLEAAARDARLDIEFTGRLPRCAVLEIVAAAEFLIVPSEWYEGFPMVIAESFACGTPVLAARIGSLQELVLDGIHGGQFEAGNHEDLARHVRSMLADDIALRRMRLNVRSYFEANLSEDQNYAQLMAVYSHVLRAERQSRRKQG